MRESFLLVKPVPSLSDQHSVDARIIEREVFGRGKCCLRCRMPSLKHGEHARIRFNGHDLETTAEQRAGELAGAGSHVGNSRRVGWYQPVDRVWRIAGPPTVIGLGEAAEHTSAQWVRGCHRGNSDRAGRQQPGVKDVSIAADLDWARRLVAETGVR